MEKKSRVKINSHPNKATIEAGLAAFSVKHILVHKMGAMAVTRWASGRPNALVATIEPVAGERFSKPSIWRA